MNLAQLRAEVRARGFDYLPNDRINQFLNVAMHEVCEAADWPFLEATATGTPPLTINDLRTVESVEDTASGRKLLPIDRRDLTDRYRDLTVTGDPCWYYLDGTNIVDVFPRGGTLRVRYFKTVTDLASDSDTPVIPGRYQYIIIDWAVARCFAANDEPSHAEAARQEGDRIMAMMRESLLGWQHDRPLQQTMMGGHLDQGWC